MSEQRALIVTGAAGGLGAAAARVLLERGARVVAVDLDESQVMEALASGADAAVTEDRLACVAADVSSSSDAQYIVDTALDRFGQIDGLFNNAATLGPSLPIGDYCEEAFRRVLDVNVTGVWLVTKAALPELERAGGRVVNTASIAGLIGWRNLSGYTAAKHAVIGLTRAVAIEVAEAGVTVNALCPGSMDTPMLWEGVKGLGVAPKEAREILTAPVPAGHIADPREVAEVAAWLLLDAPSYLTGAVVPVDGGQLAA